MPEMVLENIWTFETANFCVSVDAMPEYAPDLSWMDADELALVDRGSLLVFTVRAQVTDKRTGIELATDYLGNCVYENFADFRDHIGIQEYRREQYKKYLAVTCEPVSYDKFLIGSYFSDMVRNVCDEARTELDNMRRIYSNA